MITLKADYFSEEALGSKACEHPQWDFSSKESTNSQIPQNHRVRMRHMGHLVQLLDQCRISLKHPKRLFNHCFDSL